MKWIVFAVIVALSPVQDAARAKKCDSTCTTRYTAEYLRCGQVVECRSYVDREYRICYDHCVNDGK